jgi:predicted nucleotidyltransferase
MGKMDSPLPASIQPLLDAYLDAIEPLRAHFYGIYIYGSIALGAFEELASDIDLSPETLPPPGEKNLSRRMSDLRDDT